MRKHILALPVIVCLGLLLSGCGPTPPPYLQPTATPPPSPTPTTPATPVPLESIRVGLELVAEGFTAPVALVEPPDGSGRLFIVDQIGLIRIVTAQRELLAEPFLDIRHLLVPLQSGYDERGLLGLAFHPQFAQNGRFFIYYSAPLQTGGAEGWDHTDVLAEYRVSTEDPNKADSDSERIILAIDHQRYNHDGGQILFGPDGYLYLGDGDGGGAGDPEGDAQDINSLLGKILRIDIDQGDPYAVPSDNPFVGKDGADEIFAYGFRNPYRFSFDIDGRLFAGDAGQNLYEEVDIVVKGGNYGWNIKEATSCFSIENCPDSGERGEPLLDPIIEYDHSQGQAVIGGFIYRGTGIPPLFGLYVFGDWGLEKGKIFVAAPSPSGEGMWSFEELRIAENSAATLEGLHVLGFGQDHAGELYLLTSARLGPTGSTGRVFRIVPS